MLYAIEHAEDMNIITVLQGITIAAAAVALVCAGWATVITRRIRASLQSEDARFKRLEADHEKSLADWREERSWWFGQLAEARGVDPGELRITQYGDELAKVRTRSEMAAWRRSLATSSDERPPS